MGVKKIEAIIRPHLLDQVRDQLQQSGVQGMSVSEVKGYGRQKGHSEIYRGREYNIEFVPKVKIEVVLEDDLVDEVVEVILRAARTGNFGDGKIFVLNLDEAYRIRTGEYNEHAV
jgi:nitrogen regulatory protein P-II 1